MKKNLIITALSGLLLLGVVSCGLTIDSSSEEVSNSVGDSYAETSEISLPSSESNSTSSEVVGENHKYADSYYEIPEDTIEYVDGLSVSGALIDVNVDKQFVTGVSDTFSFSYTRNASATSNATSSNEDVFKIEKISETNYKIIPVHEGNAVLHITDSKGLDRYNHIVYVRDAMAQEEMEEYLSDVEYWVSYAGYGDSYKMTFLFDNQVAISGSLQGVAFSSYTATFKLFSQNDTEYIYTFDTDSQKNSSGLTGFNISKTGDFMYLQYTNGTAAIMFPNTRKVD